ncbi:MAG: DEAD/DEAH box helicase [Flavobacteriales bacterium]
MTLFSNFKLSSSLLNALEDRNFTIPTQIQKEAYSVIRSGKDMIGIAQTGTGKTIAYLLPILQDLKFSKELNPRVLIMVPTRELVLQVVEEIEKLTTYQNVRILGVYGGTNINTQKRAVQAGTDIIVATPGRLYDLVLSRFLQLKNIKKLVIDEVDVMLDLGFRFQLTNIFDVLPSRRQNIMFSATMTEDIELLINDFFITPQKISVALSGTPLKNIKQIAYPVPNFYTKIMLLIHLLEDENKFHKVLVFVANKRNADRVFEELDDYFGSEVCVIHSNKTQNYRIRSIRQFDNGENRILVATDVMARGLDLDKISHVINIDTPHFPENYIHRIGRTGRAEEEGSSILFFTEKENDHKIAIETLMNYQISVEDIPKEIEISKRLLPEEQTKIKDINNPQKQASLGIAGPSFHEKKEKNKKVNQRGAYQRKLKQKYKKPKTRGDKNYNKSKKK